MKSKSKFLKDGLVAGLPKLVKQVGRAHLAYAFPNSLKKIACSAAFMMAVQPLSGTFFPTAQEYGKKLDIPEQMVTETVGDKPTYVRSGILGMVSQVYDFPLFVSVPYETLRAASAYHDVFKANASAKPATSLGGLMCRVNMTRDDAAPMSMHELLAPEGLVPEHKLSKSPLPQTFVTDLRRFIYFHELRHCNNQNITLELKEPDADAYAIKAVEKLNPQSQIREFVTNWRALDRTGKHSHVQQLLALLKGQELSLEALETSNEVALPYLQELQSYGGERYEAMPEMAQERVDMFFNAISFFHQFEPRAEFAQKQPTILKRSL